MKIYTTACLFIIPILLSFPACTGASSDNYIDGIREQVIQYNSARDLVDQSINAVDSASTGREGLEAARRGVSDLQSAISQMNEAYKAFGNQEVPRKYREHQQATLSAWRAGIEATTTIRLYMENALTTGQPDDLLVLAANRLFAEEDRHQLQARRALQATG